MKKCIAHGCKNNRVTGAKYCSPCGERLWLKFYYPQFADEVPAGAALNHSLRKWLGLTKKALREHGLSFYGGDVFSRDGTSIFLNVDAESCALCQHFLDDRTGCATCPIVLMRGYTCCDARHGEESEYSIFGEFGEARPMIALLRRTKKWAEKTGWEA